MLDMRLIPSYESGVSNSLTNRERYSLRHTAICKMIILSHSQVNIFNLAKSAGASVEQIEQFYARNLPLSAEMARNLQSGGRRRMEQGSGKQEGIAIEKHYGWFVGKVEREKFTRREYAKFNSKNQWIGLAD